MTARLLYLISCLFLLPYSASAQLLSNMYIDELDNGLQVLVLEDADKEDVTIQLRVKGGASTEPPRFDGFSHLYEHLFFQLVPDRKNFLNKAETRGAKMTDSTGQESISYTITLPPDMLGKGLHFMSEAARYPVFDMDELKEAKHIIDAEYQKSQAYPMFLLHQDMKRHLWKPFFSRKNTFGNPKALKRATPSMLDTFRHGNIRPEHTLIAVAGDVEHEDIFKQVFNIFDNWPEMDGYPYDNYTIPNFPRVTYASQYVTQTESAHNPVFLLCFQGPDTRYNHEGTYAAKVFARILSQEESRLHTALIDSGLAKSVDVSFDVKKHKSPLRITMRPDSGNIKEAHQVLRAQIEQWDRDSYYTDAQFQKAKKKLHSREKRLRKNTVTYLNRITERWASASFAYHVSFRDSIKAVSREDINNFAREYIDERSYVAGLVVDSATRDTLQIDSFFTTTPSLSQLAYRFKSNSAQLKSKQDSQKLLGLTQWMKINPKARIKVNGIADKSEFLKIRDKTYLTYMDTIEALDVPHRLTLPKTYVRLDVLRSMKIVKALTDAGINPSRLSGSGRLEKGENQKQVRENRKANVTLREW